MLDLSNSNTRKWAERRSALRVSQDQKVLGGPAALRDALCELTFLCRDAPIEISTAYRNIPDEILTGKAVEFHGLLMDDLLAWEVLDSPPAQALHLGAQLLALDMALIEGPFGTQAPTSGFSLLHAPTDSFVIPRPFPRSSIETGPGNGFERRATPHHRIVPRCIGSYTIKPVWEPRLSLGRVVGTSHALGAALFPGLELEADGRFDRFVPKSANCGNAEGQIAAQVGAAFQQPLLAAVWPELTIPPDRLACIRQELELQSGKLVPNHGPSIVVAGSWYEEMDGRYHNCMPILDKLGIERLRYRKSLPYARGKIEEAAEIDLEVPLLITPDALITFAVCLDFCELQLYTPYDQMDVDLVLVASLGNLSTMNGHQANSLSLRARGGRAFVCQQSDSPSECVGWVLPAEKKDAPLKVEKPWAVRNVKFS